MTESDPFGNTHEKMMFKCEAIRFDAASKANFNSAFLLSGGLLFIASGCCYFLVVAIYSRWVAVDSWRVAISCWWCVVSC